jgi:Uma2 family endonuclease
MSTQLTHSKDVVEPYYPASDGHPMAESDKTRRLVVDCIQTLERYFADQPDVYVSGNILIYYREGDPTRSIAPDVLVTRGIEKRARSIYQTWVEGKMPDVVIEIVSETTWRRDLGVKATLYHALGVQEYFLFDSTGQLFDQGTLLGMVRHEPGFREIPADEQGRLWSEVLQLTLAAEEGLLRFYDPTAGTRLQTLEARAAAAEARASQAEEQLRRLEAELQRLRDQSDLPHPASPPLGRE